MSQTTKTRRRPVEGIPLARLTPDAKLAIPLEPGAAASDEGVWVIERVAGTLVRVAAKDNVVGAPIRVGAP